MGQCLVYKKSNPGLLWLGVKASCYGLGMKLQLDLRLMQRLLPAQSFAAQHPMFQYKHSAPQQSTREFLQGAERVVILGMGGSVLPLQSLCDASGMKDRVVFLDSIDPEDVERMISVLGSEDRLCVVSKSGKTFEVQALMRCLQNRFPDRTFLVVTDEESSPLVDWAKKQNWPLEFIPSALGGRFTNFSPFHQALLEEWSVDYSSLLQAAKKQVEELKKDPSSLEKLFALQFANDRDLVIWHYGSRLNGLAQWLQQALAESLGKKSETAFRVGRFPILLQGPRDQHSVLQYLIDGPQRYNILFMEDADVASRGDKENGFGAETGLMSFGDRSLGELLEILAESNYRVFEERTRNPETYQALCRIKVSTRELTSFAATLAFFQAYVEYAGNRLGVNPYDQPGVERGKNIARELLH